MTVAAHITKAYENWENCLAVFSLRHLQAYDTGYTHVCSVLGVELPQPPYNAEQRNIWLVEQLETSDEQHSRLNAFSWLNFAPLAYLHSRTEQDAIEFFFELLERAHRECPDIEVPASTMSSTYEYESSIRTFESPRTLDELLESVCDRPAMFVGNEARLVHLWSMLKGYLHAHRDHGVQSLDEERLQRFQNWMNQRYPYGKSTTWAHTLDALSMQVSQRSFDSFTMHWEMYRQEEAATAQDPVMRTMIEHIIASHSPEK